MTSAVLVLALSLPGQSPQAYPAAQAPAKVAPAPQAPAKVAPAPQAPSKIAPAPCAPSKVAPAPQGLLPTLRQRLPRLLRRLLPTLRRRLPRLPALRRSCPGSSGGCSLCSVEGGPGSLAPPSKIAPAPQAAAPYAPSKVAPAPQAAAPYAPSKIAPAPQAAAPYAPSKVCPGSSGGCSLRSVEDCSGSSGSGQGGSGSSSGCSLCSGQGRSPILSKSFSTSRAWSFALIAARPSSIRFDDRFAGDVSHSGARRLCVCRLRAHIYWPGG